ncbi:MAG: GspH/FimT family pseudopilin [Pseudomonas sp.]|nr:GspH/FimT family pseudopilin [Pseudomonas sp.]MDD2223512.1 GspH/FimT family pseudopilin [Pseudomonas sp.]MDY0415575.1 GspH/FimT family pseudopilin [Pseudomonas sp.]
MQKLAAGSKSFASRGIAGFTLIEMLVVLTIVALTLAIVVPAVSKSMVVSVHDVARDVQISLRQARAKAVNEQQSALFWVDIEQHQYLNHKSKTKSFPEDINMRAKVASSEVQGQKAGIRFFPDGSSTGGRLTVTDAAVAVHVDIDWLTGRVSVTDED